MVGLIALFVLVCLSAFFSLSETALTSVNRVKIKKMAEEKHFGAKSLKKLREDPNKMLATILVGNNLVNLAAASLATFMFFELFAKNRFLNEGLTVAVSTIVMTFIILIFGEIVPKTSAMKYSEKIASSVAPVILAFSLVLTPVISLLDRICRPILKLFGADVKNDAPFVTEDELKLLLSMGEKDGVLETSENKMIHSIFEFGDTVAKEVMVPKPDMFCLDINTPIEDAMQKISEDGHSRIPVFEGANDNIIGLVMAKDLIKVHCRSQQVQLRDLIRSPLFVPETKKLDDLMRLMQSSRTHIAIVVDEYGGVAGLVTLEDLLEEIVGEIQDEFDKEEKGVETLSDGTILVDAKLSVKDVNEKLGTDIPEGDYDTMGGFVLSLIGRLAYVGDSASYGDLRMTVEKISKRRITRVRINR